MLCDIRINKKPQVLRCLFDPSRPPIAYSPYPFVKHSDLTRHMWYLEVEDVLSAIYELDFKKTRLVGEAAQAIGSTYQSVADLKGARESIIRMNVFNPSIKSSLKEVTQIQVRYYWNSPYYLLLNFEATNQSWYNELIWKSACPNKSFIVHWTFLRKLIPNPFFKCLRWESFIEDRFCNNMIIIFNWNIVVNISIV